MSTQRPEDPQETERIERLKRTPPPGGYASGGPVTSGIWFKPEGHDWTDLSPHIHTDHEAATKRAWTDLMDGLQETSISVTFDNRDGTFTPLDALFKTKPRYRVSYETPDGRWQRIKHWLKRHGLTRLKVRMVTYSFDTELTHTGDGFNFTAAGPVSKGLEER